MRTSAGGEFWEGVGWGELTADFDVEEVDIVGGCVHHGPECDRVGDLTVEPDVFVCGEEPDQLWADEGDDVAHHGDEKETGIKGEGETSAPGSPDGPPKTVEGI